MAMFDRHARFQAEVSKRTHTSGKPPASEGHSQAVRPASSGPADFAVTIVGLDSVDLPGPTDEPDDPTNCCVEVNAALST
ncbi:MAG: hypothetical protein Q7T71_06120, partial [Herbiconiux sp.]|nr:hypothetical protein [Herbiconiux sp.]